jgi:Fe-S-cluster containining protein
MHVTAQAPEILAIIEYLELKRDATERQRIQVMAQHHHEILSKLSKDERHLQALTCPLLVDNKCSVYDVRPIACRGFHSSSVEVCKAASADRTMSFPFPKHDPRGDAARAAFVSLNHELTDFRKDANVYELFGGLAHGLADSEGARERWTTGEAVFPPTYK